MSALKVNYGSRRDFIDDKVDSGALEGRVVSIYHYTTRGPSPTSVYSHGIVDASEFDGPTGFTTGLVVYADRVEVVFSGTDYQVNTYKWDDITEVVFH